MSDTDSEEPLVLVLVIPLPGFLLHFYKRPKHYRVTNYKKRTKICRKKSFADIKVHIVLMIC